MRQKTERVKRMEENFMQLHAEGKSIPEIAEIFHISDCSIYLDLQYIADSNGVTRDSLLKVVQKPHEMKNPISLHTKGASINPKELLKDFEELSSKTTDIIKKIDEIITTGGEN